MKIELSEFEITHIMDALRERINDLRDTLALDGDDWQTADLLDELVDLEHDLFEASARPADWTEDLEPTEIAEPEWSDPEDADLFMDPVEFAAKHDTEAQMIQAGIDAREQVKASSRAAARRDFNLRGPDRKLSETQKHDLWSKPSNDPADW